MQFLLWFSLILVAFIYFGYPVVIFVIARILGKEVNKSDITPSVSLIIPVHNEEKVIDQKIQNILQLDYPEDKLEIIFALDGCTDRTKEIILENKNGRITILDKEEREGKVRTLNKAVKTAKGEIVVFSDANSIHKQDTLRKLVRNFADKETGCVCGRLKYTDTDNGSVGEGEDLYWKYEYFLKRQESRIGKLIITNGSIQAIRRSLYPYPDPEIADDFSIPLLVQTQGYRVLYEPQAVVREVATQSLKEEFNQKVRIISQGFKGAAMLRRDLLKLGGLGLFEFLFHKLLRWLVPLFLTVIFVSNIFLLDSAVYFNLFILQSLFYLFSITGYLLRNKNKIKVFYIPFYFCLVNFTSLVAMYRVLIKAQTRIWEKAHSTRATPVKRNAYCVPRTASKRR
ncbi:MAG: glycosyltransferase family 2 protein [Candidatus Omnitrophica bacterium]|nr:glycosyltransferase family 2 protein [Candidatus Omnitrophota bacterium]